MSSYWIGVIVRDATGRLCEFRTWMTPKHRVISSNIHKEIYYADFIAQKADDLVQQGQSIVLSEQEFGYLLVYIYTISG
jgi:hypothetical protein